MATEQETMQDQASESTEVQPIIPGTTYRTPEEAAKGFQELKSLLDRQGAELGTTRKMLETMMAKNNQPKGQEAKPEKPAGPDYDTELAAIDAEIEKLDVDEPGYAKKLATLNKKSRDIVTAKVASALTSKFEETLTQYDQKIQSKQAQMEWHRANPDFETPEMQMAIQDYMARDRSGIMDPYLAYREIQQQQMSQQMQALAEQKAELENRLKLKEGAAQTGKVITKGQSTQAVTQPKTKLKGADLDAAMLSAYEQAGGRM